LGMLAGKEKPKVILIVGRILTTLSATLISVLTRVNVL